MSSATGCTACLPTRSIRAFRGPRRARDFVEFPSQFNEHWAHYPAVFDHYAQALQNRRAHAGRSWRRRSRRRETSTRATRLTELLAAAELDMQWHMLPASAPLAGPGSHLRQQALEKTHLALQHGAAALSVQLFQHIWGGGYAAGYYAYLWTQMLDDDAFQWFEENGGMTRANGDRFRQMVLSRGNTEDLASLYATWRGRAPKVDAMLKDRGLVEP